MKLKNMRFKTTVDGKPFIFGWNNIYGYEGEECGVFADEIPGKLGGVSICLNHNSGYGFKGINEDIDVDIVPAPKNDKEISEEYPDAEDGDIYYNPYFGDLWIVQENRFVKINDGYSTELDDPIGFIKVGHINRYLGSGQRNIKDVPMGDDNNDRDEDA